MLDKLLADIERFNNNNYHNNNITNNNVQDEIKNTVTIEEFLNNINNIIPKNISNTTVEPNNTVDNDLFLKFIQDVSKKL